MSELINNIKACFAKAIELEAQRDRLLVLATKHCDKNHKDWQEIINISSK
jgi:hypothetical protein